MKAEWDITSTWSIKKIPKMNIISTADVETTAQKGFENNLS